MRRLALVPLIVGVLLFPSAASALGLGEIEMQSALNQRLDAEIPLRGVPEDAADQIIVSLASEEAFRRVELQRPHALTRLRFEVRQHDDDRYYIHVTSNEPIVEPYLSFLIEVDWPDSNLLREYTVLLDPPVFVSDSEEETATAEEAEAPDTADEESMTAAGVPADIERDTETEEPAEEEELAEESETIVETDVEPAAEPEEEAEPETVTGDHSDTPVFLQVEQDEERAEAEARRSEEEEMAAAEEEPEPRVETATATGYDTASDEYGPVERGEALWNIAEQLKRDDMTVQQMMLALLRYNPDAFVEENINRLRQGYVLRIPDAEEVLSLSAQQAVAQVREQNSVWQEFRTAARSGTGRAEEEETAAPAEADEEVAGEDSALEIVGSDEGTGASTDESASAVADTEGEQAEELKLAREQLESARLEKEELESRVGELEETVGKMERLIEVREDQLARLQEQLQKVEQGEDVDESALAEADDIDADETGTEDEAAAEEADDESDEAVVTDDSGSNGESEDTAAEEEDTQSAAADGDDGATDEDESAAAAEDTESATVTTERTQPGEPDWLDKAGTFWDSVKGTVGGMLAGVGIGSFLDSFLGSFMANPLALPIAGGAAVLLLLGGLLIMRRRQGGAGEEVVEDRGEFAFAGGTSDDDDQFGAMLQSESGDDVAVEEEVGGLDETGDAPFDTREGSEDAESALMSEEFDLGDLEDEEPEPRTTGSTDSPEDETIAEADVYLAYGLHQQAEDLLKLALQEQPERLDYQAKMLETLYGAGKTQEFVDNAESFRTKIDDPNDRLWQQTVAMGKELAPDNPLFQQDVDETLKPSDTAATAPPATDFELGGDEEDTTDLDFSFDEAGGDEDDDEFARTVMLGADDLEPMEGDAGLVGPEQKGGGAAEEPESADEEAMDFDLSDFALDSDEEGTADSTAGMEAIASGEAGTDEDLEFDLGDLDMGEDSASPATAGAADESGKTGEDDFDLGELDLDDTADNETAATAGTDDDSPDFDLGDLEESTTETAQEQHSGGEEDALDLGDFDFDARETAIAPETGAPENEETVTFDTGDDASLADLESDLSAGEPAAPQSGADSGNGPAGDEDDFDTMLDLARAYIDMGDAESARATLEEIAEAGSDKQRNEAQNLLESV